MPTFSDAEKLNCKRKVRYASDFAAKTALKKTRSFSGKVPSRVYKCPVCLGFHLTSKPRR
jgi:hypothetical protein